MNKTCQNCSTFLEKGRRKFCSKVCIKRTWYLKHRKGVTYGEEAFWKTPTGKGFRWEEYAAKLLGAKHLKFNMGMADLIWKEFFVDVKACEIYRRKFKRGKPVIKEQAGVWVFNRNKPKKIDYFLCFCLEKDIPTKILLIPSNEFGNKGIVVGKKSKFDIFSI